MGDNLPAVCYAIEGNVVDRNAGQNGKGWCEGVAPSLSTQDRHAVCFRKASKPCADGKGERWEESGLSNTLNGFEFHSDVRTPEIVCSSVDCRNLTLNREISGTLQCKSEGGYSLNYQNPVIYDARGNGRGGVSPTLTGDHQNRITDYTSLVVFRKTASEDSDNHPSPKPSEPLPQASTPPTSSVLREDDYANSSGGGIAATLDASYYKGTGARNGNEREYIAILKKVRS